MSGSAMYLCPQCQIGHLQPDTQTYVRVVNGMVISVPGMAAVTCDVCGYHEFEQDALTMIEALVGQAGTSAAPERPAPARLTPDSKTPPGLKR